MLTTARRGIQYPNPDRSDRPDIPAHFGYVAAAADVSTLYAQGTDAARIARAHIPSGGLFFYCTDTTLTWYDDGAAWHQVGSFAGVQLDYAQITADITGIAVTTEATATVIINANTITYAGDRIKIEFFVPGLTQTSANSPDDFVFVFLRDAIVIGQSRQSGADFATRFNGGYHVAFDTPPAAAHQYSVKGFAGNAGGTWAVKAGIGGSGAMVPAFLRTTRA